VEILLDSVRVSPHNGSAEIIYVSSGNIQYGAQVSGKSAPPAAEDVDGPADNLQRVFRTESGLFTTRRESSTKSVGSHFRDCFDPIYEAISCTYQTTPHDHHFGIEDVDRIGQNHADVVCSLQHQLYRDLIPLPG
jgi:hypothetical protein